MDHQKGWNFPSHCPAPEGTVSVLQALPRWGARGDAAANADSTRGRRTGSLGFPSCLTGASFRLHKHSLLLCLLPLPHSHTDPHLTNILVRLSPKFLILISIFPATVTPHQIHVACNFLSIPSVTLPVLLSNSNCNCTSPVSHFTPLLANSAFSFTVLPWADPCLWRAA